MPLTKQQQMAVENRGGSLLVSAAAGSGKTKVLVERLLLYMEQEGCQVDDFLIITYTKAAAAELRGKIARELTERVAQDPANRHLRAQLLRVYQADIKTVDAFCVGLLRENAHLLAPVEEHSLTPDFRVLDEQEALLLRQRVLERVLEEFYAGIETDEPFRLLAETLGAGRDDRALEQLVLELQEKTQSHPYPLAWLEQLRREWEIPPQRLLDSPYGQQLKRDMTRTALFWAQTLERAVAAMEDCPAVLKSYGDRFLEVADGLRAFCAWEDDDWDAMGRALPTTFRRMGAVRGEENEASKNRARAVLEQCKKALKTLGENFAVPENELLEDLREMAPAMLALLRLTDSFIRHYQAEKVRRNVMDFSDQEHYAIELLTDGAGQPTELAQQVASRYREVMVDEYQDSNQVQNCIFRALSGGERRLFAVGDVKQSIYRFRLADPSIFLGKYLSYVPAEEAEDGQPRKVMLSRNFRSRREVLDGTNFIFRAIMSREMGDMDYGDDEQLYFGAEAAYPPREGAEPEFHFISVENTEEERFDRTEMEAHFVARRIRQLLDEGFAVQEGERTRPVEPEDIVILMRSPRARLPAYTAALRREGIPCSSAESQDFFSALEVAVLLSFLQVIDNPRQDVPLIAVLRSPLFGFSPDRLAQIRALCPEGDYYDALCRDEAADSVAFLQQLAALRLAARDMAADRLLWKIYTDCHVMAVFGAMEEGQARKERLVALYTYAGQQTAQGRGGLYDFVSQLHDLMEEGRQPPIATQSGGGGVQLMSVHRSKGLEFPVVILADLHKEFNREDLQPPVLVHPQLGLGVERVDRQRRIRYDTISKTAVASALRRENKAEEMRILYVALTRAKEKLICVDCMAHARKRLKELAAVTGGPVPPEAVAGAKCPGDWLLLPLLCAPEGEPLRRWAEAEPEELCGIGGGWQVHIWENPVAADTGSRESGVAAEPAAEHPIEVMELHYPHQAACTIPSKVTATQLKGRELDEEIAQGSVRRIRQVKMDTPRFLRGERPLDAAQQGTATHLLMQYLELDGPEPEEQVAGLLRRQLLTPQQAEAIDCGPIRRFMVSPLAQRIREAGRVYREYRFALLLPAALYEPQAQPEDELMLQGVVDCAFETEKGLVIVDFKTDRITAAEAAQRAERYRPQLSAYSEALSRVLELPVAEMRLYFFAADCEVEL